MSESNTHTDSKTIDEESIEKYVNIIIKQTTYTQEEARQKLEEENYNYINVIKKAFGINTNDKKTPPMVSINQGIYKEIRNFMDKSAREYDEKKSKLSN